MKVTFDSLLVWLNFLLVLIICFAIDLFILSFNALFLKSLKHEVLLLKDKNNISEEYIKTLDNPIKELLYEKLDIEDNKEQIEKEIEKKEEEKEKVIQKEKVNDDMNTNKDKNDNNQEINMKKIEFNDNNNDKNNDNQQNKNKSKIIIKKSKTTKKKIKVNGNNTINLKENGNNQIIINLNEEQKNNNNNNNNNLSNEINIPRTEGISKSINNNFTNSLIHNNDSPNKKAQKPFGNIHFSKTKNKKTNPINIINGKDDSQKNSFSINKDITERKLLKTSNLIK